MTDRRRDLVQLLYKDGEEIQRTDSYKISKYAYGEDYHRVVKDRLKDLVRSMQEKIGDFHARVFTDSAPVMERSWAQRSGLGWIGKHTNLLSRDAGSWFFLGELYTDLPLPVDAPATERPRRPM